MKEINNRSIKPGDFFVSNQCLQIVSEIRGNYLYTISCGISRISYKKSKNGFWYGFPYGRVYRIEEIFRINDLEDLKNNIIKMSKNCYPVDYVDVSRLYTKIKSGNFKKWPIYKVGDTFTKGKCVMLIKKVLKHSYKLECINIDTFMIITENIYHTDFCDFRKITQDQYNDIKGLATSVNIKRLIAKRIIKQ